MTKSKLAFLTVERVIAFTFYSVANVADLGIIIETAKLKHLHMLIVRKTIKVVTVLRRFHLKVTDVLT